MQLRPRAQYYLWSATSRKFIKFIMVKPTIYMFILLYYIFFLLDYGLTMVFCWNCTFSQWNLAYAAF